MTSSIAVAGAALQLATGTLQQLGSPINEAPKRSNFIVTHWPVCVSGLSLLITAVSAVAFGVFGNIPMAVALGVAAAGCVVSAIYAWTCSSLKDLDSYVASLARSVTALSATAFDLHKSNKELKRVEAGFKKDLDERTRVTKKLEDDIKEALDLRDKAAQDRQKLEKQMAQMQALFDGSQSLLTQISTKTDSFLSLNKDLTTSGDALEQELSDLKALGPKIDAVFHHLDLENQESLQRKKQADETTRLLFNQTVQIATMIQQMRQERIKMAADITDLQKANASLKENVSALHQAATDLHQATAESHQVVDSVQVAALNTKLQALLELAKQKKASQPSNKQ